MEYICQCILMHIKAYKYRLNCILRKEWSSENLIPECLFHYKEIIIQQLILSLMQLILSSCK